MSLFARLLTGAALALWMSVPAFAGAGTVTGKDAAGTTHTWDVITDGGGNFVWMQGICDGVALAKCAAVKAASTAAVDAASTAAHCAAATPSQMPCIQTKLPPPSVITSQVWVVPAASLPVTVPAPAKAGTDIHSASAAPVSSLAKRLIAARPSWLACCLPYARRLPSRR